MGRDSTDKSLRSTTYGRDSTGKSFRNLFWGNDQDVDNDPSQTEGDNESIFNRSFATLSEGMAGGSKIAKKETRNLGYVKMILIAVLLCASVAVSATMFVVTRNAEIAQFEGQFQDQAERIMEEFSLVLLGTIGAVDNFGVTITSHVRSMNLEWPFPFVPEFDIRAASTSTLAKARFLSFSPVVSEELRQEYEEYSVETSFWVDQALARQFGDPVPPTPMSHNMGGMGHGGMRKLQGEGDMEMNMGSSNGTMDMGADGMDMDMDMNMGSSNSTMDMGSGGMGMGDGHNGHSDKYPDIFPHIFRRDVGIQFADSGADSYLPVFECEPVAPEIVNYNLMRHGLFGNDFQIATDTREVVIGKMVLESDGDPLTDFIFEQNPDDGPFSQIAFPIFESFGGLEQSVGFLSIYVFWSDIIGAQLPEIAEKVSVVISNECGQAASFEVSHGAEVRFLGSGDMHDRKFEGMEESTTFTDFVSGEDQADLTFSGVALNNDYCPYTIHVHPSEEMKANYMTGKPLLYTLVVLGVFLVTCLTIFGYDIFNERRNNAVMESAWQNNKIVSSLFPPIVRDRLFSRDGKTISKTAAKKFLSTPTNRLRSYFNHGEKATEDESKPIADLFPYTTIMFADISGFTAWSSLREPTQVFTLLETLYGKFDALAMKRCVFKVETIGDCYVAATGVPDPQKDHAVRMALFANECLHVFEETTKGLEVALGPDTGDLNLRIGLHSGKVTAGVLRGQKSRFQLFGDTVNTASRMESTSQPSKIQCSQATADLISEAGMDFWLTERDESVQAKGKGLVKTYWIKAIVEGEDSSTCSLSEEDTRPSKVRFDDSSKGAEYGNKKPRTMWGDAAIQKDAIAHNLRLVDWHVELLSGLLRKIIASRTKRVAASFDPLKTRAGKSIGVSTPRNEMNEIIEMPAFDERKTKNIIAAKDVELSPTVVSQLRDFVMALSYTYHNNPFHNFSHASHVTMAANKLLSRVVTPDNVPAAEASDTRTLAIKLHDYTLGLTTDPLTQFAIIFSALIHDADHPGVSNGQLVKEKTESAVKYEAKSVAEQNSVDLAWGMLMDPSLSELQNCIFANEEEFRRFRQLVVNCVVATDIFDKDLKTLRNRRWDDAFHHGEEPVGATMTPTSRGRQEDFNRRATIVIEHVIQAADVAHTMQHWHVYQKWNEKLFQEMMMAYKSGRGGAKDPSEGWYEGELWFYDNYVIPLAKKLKECGVFGVASAECLDYATENRREWAEKGKSIVASFKKKFEQMEATTP